MSIGPEGHAIVHTVSRGSTLIIAVLASLLILLGVYSTPLLNLIRTTMTEREAQDLSSVTNVNREPAFLRLN
jgi:NADH:ubiquinone oxidoreductase subunit 4 (subunit M)